MKLGSLGTCACVVAALMILSPAHGQEAPSLTIRDALRDADRDLIPDRLDSVMTVTGIAITNPHFAREDIRYFVVQDDSAAIRVMSEDHSWFTDIEPGSIVAVTGLLTHRRGVEELFVRELEVRGKTEPPQPREVLVADLLSERYAHQLVRLVGHLSVTNLVPGEPLGAYLRDRSGTITVRIPERLRDDPRLAAELPFVGEVELIGIAGQSDLDAPFDSGYRFAPREPEDFVFVRAIPYGPIGYGSLLLGLASAVLALWVKRRRAESRADELAALASDLEQSREALAADMNERQRLERQLFQAQKMEALGRMAGGIAHDLNNMLTTVMGTAELLLNRATDPQTRERLSWIREAAEGSADLSRRLLELSRAHVTAPEVVDLNEELLQLLPVLRGIVRADVELVAVAGEVPARVEIDPSQLKQLFLNLAVNANDAMPDGGKLVIETGRVAVSESENGGASPPHEAYLRVSDSGTGIDPDAIERVFEPFYSTRAGGSGLGLAIVYGIVQRVGGRVDVVSQEGEGATFDLRIPETVAPGLAAEEQPTDEEPLRGSGTILLAEDDDSVRHLATQALQRAGYRVIEAENGREALRVFRDAPTDIDLLLTDVVMPIMGGAELAASVAIARPELPVVFMSGYIDDDEASDYISSRNATFVQKPWRVNELLTTVGQTMSGDHPLSSWPSTM